jgi:hypothetical protein
MRDSRETVVTEEEEEEEVEGRGRKHHHDTQHKSLPSFLLPN